MGKLVVEEGCLITNCTIDVAQVAGTVTVSNEFAVLELNRATVIDSTLTFRKWGKIVQNGGCFTAKSQFKILPYARYEINGGTNDSPSVYVDSLCPTSFVSIVASNGAVFGTKCESIVLNGGASVFDNIKTLNSGLMFKIPQNRYDTAYAKIANTTNDFKTIEIAYSGSLRHSYTGVVDIVNSKIKMNNLYLARLFDNSYAELNIEDSDVWHVNSYDDTSTDENLNRTRILNVRGDSLLTVGGDSWVEADDASFYTHASRNLCMAPGMTLNIYGGLVRMTDRLFLYPKGRVNIYGGTLHAKRIFSKVGLADNGEEFENPHYLNVSGGTLKVDGDVLIGADGNSQVKSPPEIHVVLSNGLFDAGNIQLATRSTNQIQTLAFAGGQVSENLKVHVGADNLVKISQVGAKIAPLFQGFNETTKNDFILEYVLDKSPAHILPFVFAGKYGEARRTGNLRVRLDGGVAILDKTSFDIMKCADGNNATFLNRLASTGLPGSAISSDFVSVPDTALWVTNLSADARCVSVSLADALASVSWRNGNVDFSTQPRAMGSIALSSVSLHNTKAWEVKLNLANSDGSEMEEGEISKIVDAFVAAGYADSCSIAEPDANVKLVVAPEDMPTGQARFVWDFTACASIKNPAATVTNAVVKSISFKNMPLVSGMHLLLK